MNNQLPRYANLFVVLSTLLAGVSCGRSDIAPTAPTVALSGPGTFRAQAPSTTGVMHNVEIRPRELRGGDWTTGTVFLNAPAPAGGLVFSLTASKREARVPETLVIAEGGTTGSFSFSTGDVSSDMEVLVTVSIGTESRWVQMRLLPPTAAGPAPGPAPGPTGTVTLSAVIN